VVKIGNIWPNSSTQKNSLKNHHRLHFLRAHPISQNSLYRGIVTNVNGEEYDIFYIDWGNSGQTNIASVDRPVEFWDIPAMAIPCVLENWENYEKMGEKIFNVLNYLLVSKTEISEVEFISGPTEKIVLREYIKHINTSDLKKYCYSVRIPDIEEIIKNEI